MASTDELFPTVPGIGFSLTRKPTWSTAIVTAASNKEARVGLSSLPVWDSALVYNFLRTMDMPPRAVVEIAERHPNPERWTNAEKMIDNEWGYLCGFYNKMGASRDDWLFDDIRDNTVGLYRFGYGNGFTKTFQTGQTEGTPRIYQDNQPADANVVSQPGDGTVTFDVAPLYRQALYVALPKANLGWGEVFGIGDGVSDTFQLTREMAGFYEPLAKLNGLESIWLTVPGADSVLQVPGVDYTIDSKVRAVFAAPPAEGKLLSLACKFFWRMRFKNDSQEWELFMHNFWRSKKVEVVTVL